MNGIIIFLTIYCIIYLIITIILIKKEYSLKARIARFLSNLGFVGLIITLISISYISWKYILEPKWIPIALTIGIGLIFIFLNFAAGNEKEEGMNNGLFNLFNSIKKHLTNVEDYNNIIRVLKNRHKTQIK